MEDFSQSPDSVLVDELYRLRDAAQQIADRQEAIKQTLISRGAGEYGGSSEDFLAKVLIPSPPKPTFAAPKDIEPAKKIAGETFSKLFDRIISYQPTKGFDLLAGKLLTPARSRDLLALCLVEKAAQRPYVRLK